ncbi:MAG TPA: hypothetical protein VGG91_14915 [Myxococcaceae bacterium]|jgi:hypothetical protein
MGFEAEPSLDDVALPIALTCWQGDNGLQLFWSHLIATQVSIQN